MAYSEHGNAVAGAMTPAHSQDIQSTGEQNWQDFLRGPRVRSHRFDQHAVVFYEGDAATRVYEVVEGAVMLYKLLPDGRRQVVDVLGPNDIFGLSMAATLECNAETLTKTTLRVFDRRDPETRIEVQTHISRCLMAQVEKLHDHAVLLGRKSAFERVASFFFRCIPTCAERDCDGTSSVRKGAENVIVLTMTRQEIADYLGLTIETVSRVISDFKRRGVISLEKQDHIRINSVCGLCRMTGAH
jgi:CRP/FNR family transcriptional regulator